MKNLIFIISLLLASNNLLSQTVITVAGEVRISGDTDGAPRAEARFNNPHGLEVDQQGNVYIADRWNHKIRRIGSDGNVTTLAGTGEVGSNDGPGSTARFHEPWGITVGPDGTVYVADTYNNAIRKIDDQGNVTTFSGSGNYAVVDGPANEASFAHPTGIVVDSAGTVYVCDHRGHTIRSITPGGYVTTLAGKPFENGFKDGLGSNALFNRPYGLSLHPDGSIIIADERNHRIRAVSPSGLVSTFAGTGELGSNDAVADSSSFNFPWDIACDPSGNVFVMDGDNHVIRRISTLGDVTTYVGEAGTKGATDGTGIFASFNGATAIAYDPTDGGFYIGDAYNNLIRKISNAVLKPQLQSVEYFSGDSICQGETVSFLIQPAIFDQILFQVNGNDLQNSDSHEFEFAALQTGLQEITASMVDGSGNIFNTNTFRIWVEPGPNISFTHTIISNENTGMEVGFSAASGPGVQFLWDFGDTDIPISQNPNPTVRYSRAGVFTVKLEGITRFGCSDTITKTDLILFNPNPVDTTGNGNGSSGPPPQTGPKSGSLFLPNAFSPNQDGNNDILYVRGNIADIHMQIYNSWGELVFESHDQGYGWDGTHRGQAAQMATYVVILSGHLTDGTPISQHSQVHLLR